MTANSTTTEHDEGFAAGIEAAEVAIDGMPRQFTTAGALSLEEAKRRIRALKPAPRSAEHTAEPSAQDKMLDPNYYPPSTGDSPFARWFVDYRQRAGLDPAQATSAYYVGVSAWRAALATAPSPSIEAEPVAWLVTSGINNAGSFFYAWMRDAADKCAAAMTQAQSQIGGEPARIRALYLAPPDRTPDARSTDSSTEALRILQRVVAARWESRPKNSQAVEEWNDALHEATQFVARAEAAKLSTAPHTADETRVDGCAT